MPRTKIALLYVGGSIGMKMNQKTGRIEPIESLNEIHRFLPELQKEISLDFFSIANVGSSDIDPEHWIAIARKIEEIYDDYDAFVVIHGTNTMTYTASALSFALQGLSKPIILTGALMPINDITGDGRMNLVFAFRAAQLDIAEVCVVMGPHVLRGTRVKKVEASFLETFESVNLEPLADFSREVKLHDHRLVRRKRILECRPHFDPNIAMITIAPGMPQGYLDAILEANLSGVVIRTYGPGMLSEELFPWLRELSDRDIPILATSQALRGVVDLHRYRKQTTLEKIGIISGKDMTFECAMVKLMWALGIGEKGRRLRDALEKSLVGEMSE